MRKIIASAILLPALMMYGCKNPHDLKNKINVKNYKSYVGIVMLSRQDSFNQSIDDRIKLAEVCRDGFLESGDEENYNNWKDTITMLNNTHADLRTNLEKQYKMDRMDGTISA